MSPSRASYIRMVFGFCNTVLGLSVLAMPYCFYQCGVVLGLLTIATVTYLSYSSCNILVKTANEHGVRKYEQLAFLAFGKQGKLFVEICSVILMIGYLVALLILGGNLVPEFLDAFLDLNTESRLRELVILSLGVLVILPVSFCWSRRVLSVTSTLTLLLFAVLLLTMFAILQPTLPASLNPTQVSSQHNSNNNRDSIGAAEALGLSSAASFWAVISELRLWNVRGLLVALPILANAVTCQAQLFVVCDAFRNDLTPNVFRRVIMTTMSVTFGLYTLVGVLGYAAFRGAPAIHGDMFLNFSVAPHANTFATRLFRVAFVTVNLISSPICIAPCRTAIHSLLNASSQNQTQGNDLSSPLATSSQPQQSGPRITLKQQVKRLFSSATDRRVVLVDFGNVDVQISGESVDVPQDFDCSMTRSEYVRITIGIVAVSVCIAIVVPTVEFLFALVGGLFAASLCYSMPAAICRRLSQLHSEMNSSIMVTSGSPGIGFGGKQTRIGGHKDINTVLLAFGLIVMLLTVMSSFRSPFKSSSLENVVNALHAERVQENLKPQLLAAAVQKELIDAKSRRPAKAEPDQIKRSLRSVRPTGQPRLPSRRTLP